MRPEDYVRWYESTRDQVGAPSLDPVKATGIVYAVRCGATIKGPRLSRKARLAGAKPKDRTCTFRIRMWSYAERQWVCGRCGSPWRFWERRALRGEIQETGTRQDGAEKRMQRLVDVGLAIRRFAADARWRWEAALYLAWARGESVRRLAELGAAGAFGAGAPFDWNRDAVRRRIQAGGREWRKVLAGAGLAVEEGC